MSAALLGSRLETGSSASTISGFCTSTRAIATRWRSPPDRRAVCSCTAQARPTRSSAPIATRSGRGQTSAPSDLAVLQFPSRPALTLCSTRTCSTRSSRCETMPMRRWAEASAVGDIRARLAPNTSTSPEVARNEPLRSASRVLLPAPLGPSTATCSPASMRRSSPTIASKVPNRLLTSRSRTAGGAMLIPAGRGPSRPTRSGRSSSFWSR